MKSDMTPGNYQSARDRDKDVWKIFGYDKITDLKHSVRASRVAQMIKNLPAVQETWVQSLGQRDPLEKEMTTHSNILDWRIPWTEEPSVHGVTKSQTQCATNTFAFTFNTVFIVQESLQNLQHKLKKESSVQNVLVWKEISEESNRELLEVRQWEWK